MRVIAVDDERIALEHLEGRLKQCPQVKDIHTFRSTKEVLKFAEQQKIDVAFLDIEMGSVDGLELAKTIKILQPLCAVVFVTGYSEYALQAIQMHVSGYLLKPVRIEDLEKELEYTKHSSEEQTASAHKIQVQCFGNFETFFDGVPIKFKYAKSKELLAYLIDRKGAFCELGELCAILWEDKPDSRALRSQLRHFIADILSALRKIESDDIILKRRGSVAVLPDRVDCDYYRWLNGDVSAINSYGGEYMAQYSWGEITTGLLNEISPQGFL